MPPHQHHARRRKILVIDDEASFTRLLKMNLEATGHYLVEAENDSSRALAAALGFRPDLILLDVMMPGIDGGELAAQFRARAELARVPVVFLTATVTKSEVESRAGHIGGMRFLAKPIDLAALRQCLDDHLTGSLLSPC